MKREEEIQILIAHLKNDVIKTANSYSNLLADTIVTNGKLIEAYKAELKEITKSK
jgi:hypothetical protein